MPASAEKQSFKFLI